MVQNAIMERILGYGEIGLSGLTDYWMHWIFEAKNMVMFFNVTSVREYLVKNGHVYTLRKPRKRVGNDIAVYGSRFKHKTIGPIEINQVKPSRIIRATELVPYVEETGLFNPSLTKLRNAIEWAVVARKLSGRILELYFVKLRA